MNNALDWKHLDISNQASDQWIRQDSGIEPLVADALLDEDSRPRAVHIGDGMLVILRGVNLNPGSDIEDMVSVRIWLEKDRVVSTSRRRLRSLDNIRESISTGRGPQTPGAFLVRLVDTLGDYISDSLDEIELSLENAENSMVDSTKPASSSPFSVLRRQIARIRRYMAPQREAIDLLSKLSVGVIDENDRSMLREHANRLTLILENLDLARERAMVAHEEFLALLAHEQNARMLLLSIVAAIFLPLSFLTGLMGMNVGGLPGLEYNGAFWILVALMLLMTGFILAIFRKRKWL
jgi:zinc transporter